MLKLNIIKKFKLFVFPHEFNFKYKLNLNYFPNIEFKRKFYVILHVNYKLFIARNKKKEKKKKVKWPSTSFVLNPFIKS